MTERFASVILELSVQKKLDYLIPEPLSGKVQRGSAVEVPLRGHLRPAYVIEVKESALVEKPLSIHRVIKQEPVLTEDLFALALWMAQYYICPLGRVLKTMLPRGVRKNVQTKEQYFITRKISLFELRSVCAELRQKAPSQAAVCDIMLTVKKGILLTELLERADSSASCVKSLIEKGVLSYEVVKTDKLDLAVHEYFKSKQKELRAEQQEALSKITASIKSNSFATHLLFGVTGSGKTEVYMRAIDEALKLKKGTIMLVPEISLTQQTIHHFRSRFSEPIAVLHHRLSDGERAESWDKIQRGDIRLVVGARSCIFSPMPNLGLIIVDEEHEGSYKNGDDSPTYQARDLAVMRAKQVGATVVLGSATPSLESYYNASCGKYILSKLSERTLHGLPTVTTVDMKASSNRSSGFFSPLLLSKIAERKERGEQTILFLNRRGFHTQLECQSCHTFISCPHCSVKLTFHKKQNLLLCHLCGHFLPPPSACPACKEAAMMKYTGVGTEKIESALFAALPQVKALRIDADTTRHKGSLEQLLLQFRSGKADVLVGTQMIAKGLHFPEVSLVGILNADSSLNIPDFRASEQVFQLITQVSGRAGRGQSPGEVIVQTLVPNHETIRFAKEQNFEAFYNSEIKTRKIFGFPPFSHIVKFLFVGKDEDNVEEGATRFLETLRGHLPKEFFCHPLVPPGHARVKDLYRFQFFIRGPHVATIRRAYEKTLQKFPLPRSISLFLDVDPQSLFF